MGQGMPSVGQHAAPMHAVAPDLPAPVEASQLRYQVEIEFPLAQGQVIEGRDQVTHLMCGVTAGDGVGDGLGVPAAPFRRPAQPVGIADGLALEEADAEVQVDPIVPGALAVEHDHGQAAGLEDAEGLGQGLFRIICVVQHPVGIDDIECAVGKGQTFGVPLQGARAPGLHEAELGPGGPGALERDVHARHDRAVAGEQGGMAAGAGPHLQDPLAGQVRQRHLDGRHVAAISEHVLELVDAVQQFRRRQLVVPVEGLVKGLPEPLDVFLVAGHGPPRSSGTPYLKPPIRVTTHV